ncbi:MAG: hypothetical protein IKL85_05465, partial [Lentisphaeria bacterium]|nr:hypothetical protein [Lentisphaeria bacterium]
MFRQQEGEQGRNDQEYQEAQFHRGGKKKPKNSSAEARMCSPAKMLTEASESEPIVAVIVPVVIVVPGVVIVPVVVIVVPGVFVVVPVVVIVVLIVPVVIVILVVIVIVLVLIIVLALTGDVSRLGRSKQRELDPFVVLCENGGGTGHFFELVAGHG